MRRIEDALDNDRFVLHYQPILSACPEPADSKPRLELLLRMIGDDEELIPPGAFLPVAERFDLSSRIDRWVLHEAIDMLSSNELASATLFLNLSGRSISDRLFQRDVIEVLEANESRVNGRLVFEVTETAMISNLADAREFLGRAQKLGVGVALDDFGSGMASYGYLRSLPIDYLKIDGQFVSGMLDDELALAAVRSFVDVARVLRIPTVAEHVDNEDVVNALRDLGVDYMQGYFLGRPTERPY